MLSYPCFKFQLPPAGGPKSIDCQPARFLVLARAACLPNKNAFRSASCTTFTGPVGVVEARDGPRQRQRLVGSSSRLAQKEELSAQGRASTRDARASSATSREKTTLKRVTAARSMHQESAELWRIVRPSRRDQSMGQIPRCRGSRPRAAGISAISGSAAIQMLFLASSAIKTARDRKHA